VAKLKSHNKAVTAAWHWLWSCALAQYCVMYPGATDRRTVPFHNKTASLKTSLQIFCALNRCNSKCSVVYIQQSLTCRLKGTNN